MAQDQTQAASIAARSPTRGAARRSLPRSRARRRGAGAAAPAAARAGRSPRRFVLPLVADRPRSAMARTGPTTGSSRGAFSSRPTTPMSAPTRRSSPPRSPATSPRSRSSTTRSCTPAICSSRIDDGDYRLAVDAAKAKIATQDATIARIGRQIEAQRAVIAQAAGADRLRASAQRQSAEADQQRAALEFDRSQKLAQTQLRLAAAARAGDRRPRPHRRRARRRRGARYASAEAALAGAKANLDVLQAQKIEAERARGELVTAMDKAERDLSLHRDPRAVRRRRRQQGGRARPICAAGRAAAGAGAAGQRLCRRQFQGDPARRRSGPARRSTSPSTRSAAGSIQGVVTSIAPASGAQFSLLPPDNATGNFTKVVQRVPVRIALRRRRRSRTATLRPGLSVVATVHTRDESAAEADAARRARISARRPAEGAQAVSAVAPSRRAGARRAPRAGGRGRGISTSAGSPPSSSWCSGCSWRSWTSRSSRPRCRRSRPACRPRQDEVTWVQTSYLIAEVIMIPLSGFLSRAFSTRVIFAISAGRLHADEPDVRAPRPRSTR